MILVSSNNKHKTNIFKILKFLPMLYGPFSPFHVFQRLKQNNLHAIVPRKGSFINMDFYLIVSLMFLGIFYSAFIGLLLRIFGIRQRSWLERHGKDLKGILDESLDCF